METAKCHSIMSFKIVLLLLLSLVHVLSINGMASNDDMQLDPSSILKTIVLKRNPYPNELETKESANLSEHTQMWHRKGEYCPDGTVAILRSSVTDLPPKKPFNRITSDYKKSDAPKVANAEDLKTSNWWLYFQDEQVGYWPGSLFRNLRTSASLLEWGGEIINKNKNGLHTDTQMGSGHFPSEGYSKAAYFRSLEYVDGGGYDNPADGLTGHASRPECYDIDVRNPAGEFGVHFFFGGPGFSNDCY
ncbi:hypothetical protein LINPERPRIM_LOCUS19267 [Linum perenne]